jgi:hypothetical protein
MIVILAGFVKRFFHEFTEPSVRVRQIKRGRGNAGFQAESPVSTFEQGTVVGVCI